MSLLTLCVHGRRWDQDPPTLPSWTGLIATLRRICKLVKVEVNFKYNVLFLPTSYSYSFGKIEPWIYRGFLYPTRSWCSYIVPFESVLKIPRVFWVSYWKQWLIGAISTCLVSYCMCTNFRCPSFCYLIHLSLHWKSIACKLLQNHLIVCVCVCVFLWNENIKKDSFNRMNKVIQQMTE